MKKLNYKILLLMVAFFIIVLPNFSNAAKVSVGKVNKTWVKYTTSSKVKVKWKKVKKATGYRVYVYNSSKKKYEVYATTSNTSIKIKNLKSAKRYKIKVRAYKKKGKKKYFGDYSPSVITATQPDKVKNVWVKGQTDTTISIKWSKVARATRYKVYIYNNSTKKYEYKQSSNSNSVKLTGLNDAKTYKIKVRAYKKENGIKYYGEYSKHIEAKTIPSKVTGVKEYDYSFNTISLSWDKISKEATYRVYKYNNRKNTYEYQGETKDTYFKVTNLQPATDYKFKVRAYIKINGNKNYGPYSYALDAGTSPNKTTGFRINKTTTNSIEVKWDRVKEATGYAVYVYRESSQSFVQYKTTNSTSMNITGLRTAKFYKMYVKAYAKINGKTYYSAKSSTISGKTESTDKYKAGIDVSQHQEKIDWEKVKNVGVDFAILRLGWIGNKDNHTIDTYFERNYNECKRLNIPIGVYVYCYSNSVKNVKEGADWTVKKLKGKSLELPVFIDMEDNSITKTGKKELSKMCVEYNSIIEKAGFKPGIYANKYWFDTYLEKDLRTKYTCWIAHYTSSSSVNYEDTFTIWQYSSVGKVNGIDGNADLNIMYVKKEEITPTEPTPQEPETPTPENPEPVNPEPENPTPSEPTPEEPVDPTPVEPETPVSTEGENKVSEKQEEPKSDEQKKDGDPEKTENLNSNETKE